MGGLRRICFVKFDAMGKIWEEQVLFCKSKAGAFLLRDVVQLG